MRHIGIALVVLALVWTIPGCGSDGSDDGGIATEGTTDEGTTDEGTTDEGTTDEGTTDEGTTDEGTTDEGTTDEGTTDEGTTDDSPDDPCDPNPCKNNGTCVNGIELQFTCECSGTGFEGEYCETDVDECAGEVILCDTNATCENTDSSYTCSCDNGWEGDGTTCTDIDECATDNGGCGDATFYSCANNVGAAATCADIDECADAALNNCGANADCTNTEGSFNCGCKTGWSGDGVSCSDIDECANGTCGDTVFSIYAGTPAEISVCGEWNWVPPCTPMSDPDGDGTWTATVLLQPGETVEYKYISRDSVDDPWSWWTDDTKPEENGNNLITLSDDCTGKNNCSVMSVCVNTEGSFDCKITGSQPNSCGAKGQGLVPIDCTKYGDANAFCVFSNHCLCSVADGYQCDKASEFGDGSECEPGSSCVPTPEPVDPVLVGAMPTSCGSPDQGLVPIDCTKYGDKNAVCVFSNHCMCSVDEGFECEKASEFEGGAECEPESSCLPSS